MSSYRFRSEKFFSRGFKDLAVSFDANPNTEDFATVSNENAIKQSVRNLMMTAFGERPFQQDIGSRVRGLLFEPFDIFSAEDIRDEITNTIERLEPRVEVRAVDVNISEDEYSLDVAIEYAIVGQPQTQVVEFLLERT
jgi:phage baseplate assembly protein W